MLKIKAWVVIQGVGTEKELIDERMVFKSRNFRDVKKYLENKEEVFDKNYWKHKRTKIGIIAHRNDKYIAYRFHEIKIVIP